MILTITWRYSYYLLLKSQFHRVQVAKEADALKLASFDYELSLAVTNLKKYEYIKMTKKHTCVGYTEKVGAVHRSTTKPEVLYWGEGVGVRIGLFIRICQVYEVVTSEFSGV